MSAREYLVPGWKEVDNCLCRDFEFADFSRAFAFMTRVALLAEHSEHHPNWANIYEKYRRACDFFGHLLRFVWPTLEFVWPA